MTQRWYNIYINSLTAQAAQPNINLEQIGNLKLNLPPLPTQQKIASILSAYDDLIQNYKKQIEALQTAASELYKEWFVRFRFPGWQNAKFENGIPEGWSICRLKDFGKVITGKTPPTEKEEYYGGDVMFVKTPDMHGNMFVQSTSEYLSKLGCEYQKAQYLPENSIMVSCIGTGGITAINAYPANTNQQINSIILKDKKYLPWLYFTISNMKETIEMFGNTGTTMTNLSKGKFEKLENDFHLSVFEVATPIRNIGIGTRILDSLIDLAIKYHYNTMSLQVREKGLIPFYTRFGFHEEFIDPDFSYFILNIK